jgi:ecotin
MKHIFTFLVLMILGSNLHAQNKPNYPEPKEGFKRVDLILPKVKDDKKYKVEISFSTEAEIVDCANGSFSFNRKSMKEEYAILPYRYPYFIIENKAADILVSRDSDCKSEKKVKKKIYTGEVIMIEYQSSYPRPFYIPEDWTLEYRIWEVTDKYISVEK